MLPGFVLVHGYTGSPEDLSPLARHLEACFGTEAVHTVFLPGHGDAGTPRYDSERFVNAIAEGTESMLRKDRRIVLVGHSTGGTLVLSGMKAGRLSPAAIVLAAVPRHIDAGALLRWEKHRTGKSSIALGDLARMVSQINRTGSEPLSCRVPALILQGDDDRLVPQSDARGWMHYASFSPVQCLTVPGAGHDLFTEQSSPVLSDWIARSLQNIFHSPSDSERHVAEELERLEGAQLQSFFGIRPHARLALARSPGVRRAVAPEASLPLSPEAADPVQLNIEITTRCNLACSHCARTVYRRPAQDMTVSQFRFILDLLPAAYRIVLVGLGEPTLHAGIVDLITAAAAGRRRISLVTNGTTLNPEFSRNLVDAGLSSITFSLNSPDAATRCELEGLPEGRHAAILENIRGFTQLAARSRIDTAVFSAVSSRTLSELPQLAATVASLGADAWMLSDLNFNWNRGAALGSLSAERKACVTEAIKTAFAHRIPVLRVQALEEFALKQRWRRFRLRVPAQLAVTAGGHRRHAWCLSPWQTIPVDVNGNVMLCDCQPQEIAGNLFQHPLTAIWNGERLQDFRRNILSETSPVSCSGCPRF